jgi:protein arginine N-methyltransferase 1
MYSVRDYGSMVGDERRTGCYVEALRRTVKPGDVVLDIGTGSGVLAMTACRLGARRVFAVEPADVIELARDIAAENGLADRIEFIQGVSTSVDLPQRADVVVAEIHGVMPLFARSLATLIDARERLLAPGGAMIPMREDLFASVVHAGELHSALVTPWSESSQGLDMRRGRAHVTNNFYRAQFDRADLLAPPLRWASLDYTRLEETGVSARFSLEASRAGTAHGLGLWFESALAEGVVMSNAPGQPPLIFGNAFLPWPQPVELAGGDRIDVEISATPLDDQYMWRWESRVASAAGTRAHFRQSQFDSVVLVPAKLRKRAASHVPRLNPEGELERAALDEMARGRALGDIATTLQQRFPARFAHWQDALNWVGELALRCSD